MIFFSKGLKMKKWLPIVTYTMLMTFVLFLGGCRRSSDDVWEDTKTAGRHMNRGAKSLAGKQGDSRAISSRDQFSPPDQLYAVPGEDFEPLPDYQYPDEVAMADFVAPQSREAPGDPGSSIPGISSFQDPSTNPQMARVFKNVQFEYNSNLIKGDDNFTILRNIANFMRTNPNAYVFVEGHTDERGPEAYNLSLGARRANAVRNQLVSDGVDPDHLFTISYGKEQPLIYEHHEEAWSQNRRAEFKVYLR